MRVYLAVLLTFIGLLLFAPHAASAQTADELIARADAAIRAGKFDDGIRGATAAIKLDPTKAAAYRVRAQGYLKLVEKEERSQWLPELEQRFPKTPNAERSLADVAKALELDPKDAYAIAIRGSVNYFLNDLEASVADFRKASELVPHEPWFSNTHKTIQKRLASQYSIAGSSKRMAAGRLTAPAEKEKLLREALGSHTKAVELDPTEDNLSSRAYVLEELGEYHKAIADLNVAINLEPDNHLNHWRRGVMYHMLERYGEAVESFRGGLAQLEKLRGDISLPQNSFREDIAKNLALQGKFDEAFAMFELALNVPRPSYITYYERGMAYLLKGDNAKAEADLRKSVELGRGYQAATDELRKMGKTP